MWHRVLSRAMRRQRRPSRATSLIGLSRSLAARFVDRQSTQSRVAPRVEERLHSPPCRFDLVRPLE
jgi:hypothetical protein